MQKKVPYRGRAAKPADTDTASAATRGPRGTCASDTLPGAARGLARKNRAIRCAKREASLPQPPTAVSPNQNPFNPASGLTMGCSSSVHTRGEEERVGSSLRRAEDELPGFREAKAKKRFSVVDFDKSNVRGKRQAEDERFASLDAGMQENCKPAESSAKAKKRFSVVDFVQDNFRGRRQAEDERYIVKENHKPAEPSAKAQKRLSMGDFVQDNLRGRRQAQSSSSETTVRCTFCGDKPEKKGNCEFGLQSLGYDISVTICDGSKDRGRKRSISLNGAFTTIRSRASHRRSISEDARCLGAASGRGGAPASRMSCVGCNVSALPCRAESAMDKRGHPAHEPCSLSSTCEARALLVCACRAYPSGRQRLTVTLCADNKRNSRKPVLGKSRWRWLAVLSYAKMLET